MMVGLDHEVDRTEGYFFFLHRHPQNTVGRNDRTSKTQQYKVDNYQTHLSSPKIEY